MPGKACSSLPLPPPPALAFAYLVCHNAHFLVKPRFRVTPRFHVRFFFRDFLWSTRQTRRRHGGIGQRYVQFKGFVPERRGRGGGTLCLRGVVIAVNMSGSLVEAYLFVHRIYIAWLHLASAFLRNDLSFWIIGITGISDRATTQGPVPANRAS